MTECCRVSTSNYRVALKIHYKVTCVIKSGVIWYNNRMLFEVLSFLMSPESSTKIYGHEPLLSLKLLEGWWWRLQGYQVSSLLPPCFTDELTTFPEGSAMRAGVPLIISLWCWGSEGVLPHHPEPLCVGVYHCWRSVWDSSGNVQLESAELELVWFWV